MAIRSGWFGYTLQFPYGDTCPTNVWCTHDWKQSVFQGRQSCQRGGRVVPENVHQFGIASNRCRDDVREWSLHRARFSEQQLKECFIHGILQSSRTFMPGFERQN